MTRRSLKQYGNEFSDGIIDPSSPEFQEVLRRVRSMIDEDRSLDALLDDSRKEMKNTFAEVVQNDNEAAERLAERHNRLCRGPEFIAGLALMAEDEGTLADIEQNLPTMWASLGLDQLYPGDASCMNQFRQIAKELGFFLERYSVAMMQDNLRDPHFFAAEAGGDDPDFALLHQKGVADCQCWLPRAEMNSSFCGRLEQPETGNRKRKQKGDQILEAQMWQRLRDRPWSVGVVLDIACEDEWAGTSMASLARRKAFDTIVNDINPERGSFPIEQMVGSIASIQGYETPDGKRVLLGEYDQSNIRNERSVLIHIDSTKYPAKLIYVLEDRTVDVQIGEKTYKVIVSWYEFMQPVKSR